MSCPLREVFRDVSVLELAKVKARMSPMMEHLGLPPLLWEGPRSAVAVAVLLCIAAGLLIAAPAAFASFAPVPKAGGRWMLLRACNAVFGVAVVAWTAWWLDGAWPLLTFTVCGWMITTLRYLAGGMGIRGAQRVLTFPALLFNTITIVVWYSALVPLFIALERPGHRLELAHSLLLSPLFLVLHAFNWPWTLADWYAQPVIIDGFDLWCGILFAVAYVLFYVFVLDLADLHIYPIIVVRRWWGGCVLLLLLGVCCGIWKAFATWSARLNPGAMGPHKRLI